MLPIIHREFIAILRTRKALYFQLALVLTFALLVVVRWPSDARVGLAGVQSQQVFRIFGYGLLVSILFLAPVFPATSLVHEKRRGTLELLLNSPLSSTHIFLGKLCGVFGFVVLLLVFSLPAAMACYAMGGVSLSQQLLWLYLTLFVLAVEYTALALCVSSYANSSDSALRITYGLVLGLSVVSLGPHFFLQGKPGLSGDLAEWVRCLSPIPVIMQLLRHGGVGMQGLEAAEQVNSRFLALSFAGTLACVAVTISRLNYRLFDQSRAQGLITDERSTGVRAARRLMFLVDPQRRKKGIPWYANPVMVKEFRCRRFGRLHWLLRLVALCAVISVLLTFVAATGTMDWGIQTIGGLMVLLQAALVVLLTPSLAAGLISSERESGGWDLLRMTPMRSARIVWGKLLSVIWTLLLILCATLPGYLLIIWLEPDLWVQVHQVIKCLLMAALFCLAISAALSTFFTRTSVSLGVAYVTLIGVFGGTMLVWLGRDAPFGHELVETVLLLNPMAAALSVMGTPGFEHYDLVPGSWWVTGFLSIAALIVLSLRTWYLMKPQ